MHLVQLKCFSGPQQYKPPKATDSRKTCEHLSKQQSHLPSYLALAQLFDCVSGSGTSSCNCCLLAHHIFVDLSQGSKLDVTEIFHPL